MNIAGARQKGVAQVLTTVLKFVPLAVIGLAGLFYIEDGNFTPFAPAEGGFDWSITAAATLALWAFIGLEAATVPAGEVKEPERESSTPSHAAKQERRSAPPGCQRLRITREPLRRSPDEQRTAWA